MDIVELLGGAAPDWFAVSSADAGGFTGWARPVDTIWRGGGLVLRISGKVKPMVTEIQPGTVFPTFCPERHIEGLGSFCLGLDSVAPSSRRQARLWWQDLEQFLKCQSIAAELGLWPQQHNLDHGPLAGRYHLQALRLARQMGIEHEYLIAYLDGPSWLTGEGLARLGLSWVKPRNEGLGLRRPKIRRPTRNRLKLRELVVLEARRRRAVEGFWNELRQIGADCCGTMRDCPLAQPSSH